MRRYQVWLAVGALVALTSRPAPLYAQGFSVNEHSTCAMGRAGTGVAAPCDDGSAMVFNPAGLALMAAGSTVFTLNGTFIAPSGNFTDDATGLRSNLKDRVFPIPAVYLAHGFSDKFAAGIGLFAPYGLTTDWPSDGHQSMRLCADESRHARHCGALRSRLFAVWTPRLAHFY